MRRIVYFLVGLVFVAPAQRVTAQQPASDSTRAALFVFLDCNGPNCDFDHFRREITWVNWARDREDSDIHLLITTEDTGGGGDRYTLDYIGRGTFGGVQKSRFYVSDPDDTDAEVRDALTRAIALGLVQYAETTSLASQLQIVYDQPETGAVQREEDDPWNLWVFRIGVDGSIEGEAQERAYSLDASFRADRVSENLKINFEVQGEYQREEFDELDEGQTFVNTSGEYDASLLVVWSLNERWSVGALTEITRSTFVNRDLGVAVGPAIEYNIFPYTESTRRALTFRYSVEFTAFDYELVTVEGRLDEAVLRHSLVVAADVQQPWGEIRGEVEGIQYLNDPATHRINTELRLEYRLFRGFGLDVSARVSRIKDQFFLPAGERTPEEILLRRRQRETNFRFDIGLGFSYRFGSRFANIVNPRLN